MRWVYVCWTDFFRELLRELIVEVVVYVIVCVLEDTVVVKGNV
jgi:hypothetical protein